MARAAASYNESETAHIMSHFDQSRLSRLVFSIFALGKKKIVEYNRMVEVGH